MLVRGSHDLVLLDARIGQGGRNVWTRTDPDVDKSSDHDRSDHDCRDTNNQLGAPADTRISILRPVPCGRLPWKSGSTEFCFGGVDAQACTIDFTGVVGQLGCIYGRRSRAVYQSGRHVEMQVVEESF
jgi:hypothetical protein